MKSDKNKWIEEVLKSTQGMERAQASDDLFDKINAAIYPEKKAKIVGLNYWLRTAAATIALLTLNIFAIAEMNQANEWTEDSTEASIPTIVSDFKLYE